MDIGHVIVICSEYHNFPQANLSTLFSYFLFIYQSLALVFNCTVIRMIEWLERLNSVNGFLRVASEPICDQGIKLIHFQLIIDI